jgi:hypothetical protein
MSGERGDPAALFLRTKKLLRFGTDRPQCARCKTTDEGALCRVASPGKTSQSILCHNCKDRPRKLSPKASAQKARRFKDAGYARPSCVICEEPTLQILELDHLANDANSGLAEPLCGNHHAMKSYAAEHGPMAALRLRDPRRRALVLQAAFEFGLAAILGMFAVWDGAREETARCVFFGAVSLTLVAWAMWNLAADEYFVESLGPGYDRAITAALPR